MAWATALIGAWQGAWVAYVGIPGFITTLAGMMLFRGANQYIGKSNTIPVPKQIQYRTCIQLIGHLGLHRRQIRHGVFQLNVGKTYDTPLRFEEPSVQCGEQPSLRRRRRP